VATDVFPEEPVAIDDPIRNSGALLSGHRAGALDWAFKEMGSYVLTDLKQMVRGLPPIRCVAAQPETVERLRSRPVSKS
jgi:phosphoglycerate dehydrogenase-like enzyme